MVVFFFFFFKQKTAYEMRISDWSSDVCSSDLLAQRMELSRVRGPCRQCRAAPHRVRPRDAAALAGPCPVENGRLAHRAQVAAGILEIACDSPVYVPLLWIFWRGSLFFQPISAS